MTKASDDPVAAPPSYLTKPDGARIAYHMTPGQAPGIVFLGGFASDMTGTKALALEAFAKARGQAFLRFDYQGHGQSSGAFADGTIGIWHSDALAVIDAVTDGKQILVGSSMGGWMMLLTAVRRPARIAGLIGIAAALDFTEDLMWPGFSEEIRETLRRDGIYHEPSAYSDQPYTITMKLIEDGRNHLLLRDRLAIDAPIRLLHGMADADVPYQVSLRIAAHVDGPDVQVRLIKDGDHRLSTERDLAILTSTVGDMLDAHQA
jgi:pimeloyl-ACP methyl ester carboxylesterase